jgi:hypothetical protein
VVSKEFAMSRLLQVLLTAVAALLVRPGVAHAGMPSVTLTDVAKMRLDTISFFLLGFLLTAGAVQLLWNGLRRDFVALPRLSYGKAVGVVGLWGLLFVLVLTMISGARELLTPGAWKKEGNTYQLKKEPAAAEPDQEPARRTQLARLREALWAYAEKHDGRFPPSRSAPEIAEERWQLPELAGIRYFYEAGRSTRDAGLPLAYEPDVYPGSRLVLLANGDIVRMDGDTLARAVSRGKQP